MCDPGAKEGHWWNVNKIGKLNDSTATLSISWLW